eukprot:CCRYP_002554-RA/>CCRYP_002554-RA protein AED:0.41 eAED:0.41 QI:226/0.5/0.33/1/0.5/0.66/3/0/151
MTRKKSLALLLTSCFATISYSLSCVGAFGCNYVEFITPPANSISMKHSIGYTGNGKPRNRGYSSDSSGTRNLAASHNQAGMWFYQWWDSSSKQYTCHPYPENIEIDAKWKAARVLSALTVFSGDDSSSSKVVCKLVEDQYAYFPVFCNHVH